MSLTQRLVILAGLVGLLFYTATPEQLWTVMVNYQLSWYSLGVPVAWGLILGAFASLLGVTAIQRWLEPLTLIAMALLTMGLTGAAAVFGAHQITAIIIPPLQIAAIGLGLYLFGYSYARFTAARNRHED
ncbi:hypothetical protein [Pseudidiomarina mangrovi]|uniref:hypothetical protein n=1 Tax=Pseudidiomarina mangrovi TaxID=2487133 RepID=UPI000FCBA5E9|nr:hypothetical protein [Pseudidiomarina mangrovi]